MDRCRCWLSKATQAKLEEKLEEHHATLAERVNALEKADLGATRDPLGSSETLRHMTGACVYRGQG